MRGIIKTSSIEYLNSQETKALLASISDLRDRAITILILSTGVFLAEVVEVKTQDIDWTKRTLQITGKRNREIPLNDETYDALVKWNNARPKTPHDALFLASKGKVQGLSKRAIDHLLRGYGQDAKISQPVSAQLLRATFAIRLFKKGLSIKDAAVVLGIQDFVSLKRYQDAAQNPPNPPPPTTITDAISQLDNRPTSTKLLNKLFPLDTPTSSALVGLSVDKCAITPDILFGRERIAQDIRRMLDKGQSILLTGPTGIGKSHLLDHLAFKYDCHAVYFERPLPIKSLLTTLCDHAFPNYQSHLSSKATTQDLLDYISRSKESPPDAASAVSSMGPLSLPILIIDNLDQIKSADVDVIDTLMEQFTIIAATDDKKKRLDPLWWKFKEEELAPLHDDDIRTLIRHLTAHLTISDYDMLENHITSEANGYPLAVVDMVNQLTHCNTVDTQSIRQLQHSVGVTYRDWSFAFIILWSIIVCLRFIALGIHSFEGYILAGIGTSVFLVVKYFLMRAR